MTTLTKTMITDDELLTPKEVAARLRIAVTTLRNWRADEAGPAWVKLGTRQRSPVRYRLSGGEAWLAAQPAAA